MKRCIHKEISITSMQENLYKILKRVSKPVKKKKSKTSLKLMTFQLANKAR